MDLILVEAEIISEDEIKVLCARLRELGRDAVQGSSAAVDRPEWIAARIIERLMRDRQQAQLPKGGEGHMSGNHEESI